MPGTNDGGANGGGQGNQGGAGGGQSVLTVNDGQSAGAGGAGGANAQSGSANAGAAGANGAGNSGGAGQNGGGVVLTDWRDQIPQDVRDQIGNFSNFKTAEDFARSYVNAQKMVGADKIPVPGEHTTPEEWAQIHKKLGLPEKLDDYKFDLADKDAVDPEFLTKFRETAHKAGVLPKQAKAMADWFAQANNDAYKAQVEAAKAAEAEALKGLKTEWGAAWDEKTGQANAAFREFLTKEEQQAFVKSGLANNPMMIKMFAKLGAQVTEGKIKGEGGTSGGGTPTPEVARQQLDEIKGNVKHPYYDPNHAEHAAAKKKVNELYGLAFPPKPKGT